MPVNTRTPAKAIKARATKATKATSNPTTTKKTESLTKARLKVEAIRIATK